MGSSGASKSRKEFDKSRFLYTVVVRMYEDGYLDAQLKASARALAGTRAAVDAQKLPDQVTLGDAFAPLDEDVGGVRFAVGVCVFENACSACVAVAFRFSLRVCVRVCLAAAFLFV